MKQLLSILSLLLFVCSCNGNDKAPGTHLRTEVIVSDLKTDNVATKTNVPVAEFISAILQDKSGNYWFATLGDGVCRYDGKSFTWFTKKNGLCDNYVWTIQEDKTVPAGETGIWFGTRNGVCRYDGKNMHTGNSGFIGFADENSLNKNFDFLYYVNTSKAWQTNAGNLWFGTNGGVYQYDGKAFGYLALPEADSDIKFRQANPTVQSSPYTVYSTLRDKVGNLWFGTENRGVCRYDGKTFVWFTEKGLDKAAVRAIFQDKNGDLWFGSNGAGVFRYDGKSLTNFTEEKGLANHDFLNTATISDKPRTLAGVMTIAEDKTGSLWFGTVDAGAWRYDGKSLTNYTVKQGLKSNAVYDIYKDNIGILWFATYGGGICRYDGKSFNYLTSKGHK